MVTDLRLILPALLAFVAVALGTISVVLIWEAARAAKRRREVLRRLSPTAAPDEQLTSQGLLRGTDTADATFLEQVALAIPHVRDARIRLQQAGIGWSATTYVALAVGSALAFGIPVMMITNNTLAAIVAAAFGAVIPDIHVYRRKRKRARMFEAQFPEAIDLLGRAIRAGHPLSAGIRMVAEEVPEPLAGEFRQVFEQNRFGLPFDDALLALSDRNVLVDVRIFVTAVLIQREVGGNLAEILDKISETVRARFTILRQLRVYTAQGRLSGYILAVMPIALFVAIYFLDREYVMLLVREPLGRVLMVLAVISQIIGYLWIRKIVDIEI